MPQAAPKIERAVYTPVCATLSGSTRSFVLPTLKRVHEHWSDRDIAWLFRGAPAWLVAHVLYEELA